MVERAISAIPSSVALYADVVVPRRLPRPFTYRVPERLEPSLRVGDTVVVPFGAVTVRGLIVELRHTAEGVPHPGRLRTLIGLSAEETTSPVDARLVKLASWVAEHYVTPLGQCLRLIHPPSGSGLRTPRYTLAATGRTALVSDRALSPLEQALLAKVKPSASGVTFGQLKRRIPELTRSMMTKFVERGWLEEQAVRLVRADDGGEASPSPAVRPDMAVSGLSLALELAASLRSSGFRAVLVEGTADERLMTVLATVEDLLGRERRVLIIAPEVRRAEEIWAAVRRRYGATVELWHGERSASERAATWQRMRAGLVKVMVGTRAAIFAPLDHLGVICVEEEDHPAHKDEQAPRYHARDVAWRRAELEQVPLLLLSAHASLETRVRLEGLGPASLIVPRLPTLPSLPIDVVELSHPPKERILSPQLEQAVSETLACGGRVALYLNRRGYAPALVCTACGVVPRCVQCHLALVYSQAARQVRCRACGTVAPAPDQCRDCRATQFDLVGSGTERLESEVRQLYPNARIIRLDRDSLKRRRPADRAGRDKPSQPPPWDIAVGTKLMLSELHEQSCQLVGVAYAEAGLHVPDFRASERTYQELVDVLSLRDPANGGRAVVQTCLPAHPVIRALVTGDRRAWEQEELALRASLEYPPYGHVIMLDAVGTEEAAVCDSVHRWAGLLQSRAEQLGYGGTRPRCMVLGPVAVSALRARGRSRWRLIVKGREAAQVRELVRKTSEAMVLYARRRRVSLSLDVDPLDLA